MAEPLYNLISGGRKFGPYTCHELATMLADGEVGLDSLCIRVGDGEIQEVSELFRESVSDREEEELEEEDGGDDDDGGDDEEEEELFEEVDWEDGVWIADEDEEDQDAEGQSARSSRNAGRSEVDMDEVICRFHPSILGYPKLLLMFLILGAMALFFVSVAPALGLPGGMLTGLTIALACMTLALLMIFRHFDCYIITRGRAEVVRGIIAKSSNEVRMSDIRRIDVDKAGLLGLLNVGDVKLSSSGTGGFDVVFAKVRAGHKVKKILRRVQKDPKSSKRRLLQGKTWLRR